MRDVKNTLHMEYLSFEKPIEELEIQLNKALELADDTGVDMAKTIGRRAPLSDEPFCPMDCSSMYGLSSEYFSGVNPES